MLAGTLVLGYSLSVLSLVAVDSHMLTILGKHCEYLKKHQRGIVSIQLSVSGKWRHLFSGIHKIQLEWSAFVC